MSKSTKILGAIVIFLGIVYVIERLTSTTSTTYNFKPFASVDTANIKRISIDLVEYPARGKENIVFDKGRGGWFINSPIHFPADQGEVNLFLSRIASNPSAFVVADNLSDSSAYGIGSGVPLIKLVQKDGETISFRVGNVTSDFNGCYIQMEGETKILDLTTNIRALAGESLTNWRDKNIFSFHLGDIQVVDLVLLDTLYHFLHKDTAWQLNGTNIPASRAEDAIRSFVEMTPIGFIDTSISNPKGAREKDLFNYGITLSNGARVTGKVMKLVPSAGLLGAGNAGEQVCLFNSANNQVYTVSSVLPKNLEDTLRGLRKDYLSKEHL